MEVWKKQTEISMGKIHMMYWLYLIKDEQPTMFESIKMVYNEYYL